MWYDKIIFLSRKTDGLDKEKQKHKQKHACNIEQNDTDIVQDGVAAFTQRKNILYVQIVTSTKNGEHENKKHKNPFQPKLCTVSIFYLHRGT